MPFEQVRRREPRISLRTSGSIGINSAAMDHWFGDVDHVNLYHDTDDSRLGLEPVEDPGEHSFKINTTENSGSITPTDFMNRTELLPEQTTRYHVEWDDEHEMAVADLSNPTSYYGEETEEDCNKPGFRSVNSKILIRKCVPPTGTAFPLIHSP